MPDMSWGQYGSTLKPPNTGLFGTTQKPPNFNAGMPFAQPGGSPLSNPYQPPAPQQPKVGMNTGFMPQAQTNQSMTWNIPTGMEPQAPTTQRFAGFDNIPMGVDAPQAQAPQTMNYGSMEPQAETFGSIPAPSQGYNPEAFNTQYGTLENLQPYMNPFLDQIIAKGNKAIESSAAARGGLLSSRTGQEIGDWTTGAASQAFNDARSAFNNDRGYMTGVYQDGRNFDYKNFRDTDSTNWDIFKYGDAAQRNMLNDYYNQNQGLVNTGLNASGNAGSIQGNLMQALAELYGNQGNVNAQGAVNGGNNNSNLIGDVLGGLFSMLGGGQ